MLDLQSKSSLFPICMVHFTFLLLLGMYLMFADKSPSSMQTGGHEGTSLVHWLSWCLYYPRLKCSSLVMPGLTSGYESEKNNNPKNQKRSSDEKPCSFSVHKEIPFCNWFCGTDCQQLAVQHSCQGEYKFFTDQWLPSGCQTVAD